MNRSWITAAVRRAVRAVAVVSVAAAVASCSTGEPPRLQDVGPRTVSNATDTPLLVWGEHLQDGMTLKLGPPFSLSLPVTRVDDVLGGVRLPARLPLPAGGTEVAVDVSLVDSRGRGTGHARLVIVNDLDFPDLVDVALAPSGDVALAVSQTTDELVRVDLPATGPSKKTLLPTADGPVAVAIATLGGARVAVVAHRAPELWLFALDGDGAAGAPRRLPTSVRHSKGLLVHDGKAYLSDGVRDRVVVVDLESGAELGAVDVDPNPGPLTITPRGVVVGSLQTGRLQRIELLPTPRVAAVVEPTPETAIVGHTAPFRAHTLGGKSVRSLGAVGAAGRDVVIVASTGPNIGPHEDRSRRAGTTGIGGVGVVDAADRYVRHVGNDAGLVQDVAVHGDTVYAADLGLGLVHAYDAAALADGSAQKPRWSFALPPLPELPFVRAPDDFGVNGRAGVELHTGPQALAVSADGRTLVVLERFSLRLTVLRLPEDGGPPAVVAHHPLYDARVQVQRRQGQVVYFTDMGRSGMTCDGCHREGADEGVFFAKAALMRLYRSPPIWSARDTPPYFNPGGHATLQQTAQEVTALNRFFNPAPGPLEIQALTVFSKGITAPPNPHRTDSGAPPATLSTSLGSGSPALGRALFSARCASCHPAPLFTLDQDAGTRGKRPSSGLPVQAALAKGQEQSPDVIGPPALNGLWDMWPLLSSGLGGYVVDGGRLKVGDTPALARLVELHGGALTDAQRADLLAFLLSL